MPNQTDGTQFFTRVKVGDSDVHCMLEGGSQVNTITENFLVDLLNSQRALGIKMGDTKHPILQLEKWPEDESVRGVAGGALVPLVGAVVLRMRLCKKGSPGEGPDVKVRFKITASGSTDWVGMIVGAKVIDCSSYCLVSFLN